jgi:peroxiredoxin
MKNLNSILLLCIGLLFACSPKPATLTINGEFDGMADGTKVELIPAATGKMEKPVAVAEIVNGKFTFKDSLPEPRLFFIKVQDVEGILQVMAENSTISIKGKPIEKVIGEKKMLDYSGVKITGSAVNDQLNEKMAFHKILDSTYRENQRLGNKINTLFGEARMNKNMKLMDSVSKTEEYKLVEAREKKFFADVEKGFNQAVISNKDSFWGPLLMMHLWNYFDEKSVKLYNQFPKEVQESYYGKIVKDNLPRESWVGKIVPEFSAKKVDGSTGALKDLIAGKKYILLDFWASWCGPCKKEIPNMKKQYELYHSKGFEIISISIDKDSDAWKKAVKEHQLVWPNLLDEGEVANLYKVRAVPSMFLIDNTGKIILDGARGEILASKLKELLK